MYVPGEAECILTWNPDDNQIECFCEDPTFFPTLAPVHMLDATGWIVQQDSHSFTVQFRTMPTAEEAVATVTQKHFVVEPHEVSDQLTKFWIPMWQAEHPISANDDKTCPTHQSHSNLMTLLTRGKKQSKTSGPLLQEGSMQSLHRNLS